MTATTEHLKGRFTRQFNKTVSNTVNQKRKGLGEKAQVFLADYWPPTHSAVSPRDVNTLVQELGPSGIRKDRRGRSALRTSPSSPVPLAPKWWLPTLTVLHLFSPQKHCLLQTVVESCQFFKVSPWLPCSAASVGLEEVSPAHTTPVHNFDLWRISLDRGL